MTTHLPASEYRQVAFQRMTEYEFQTEVIRTARQLGWMVYHARPAMTSKGWRTAGQGDAAGFPDLVLARAGEVLLVELKSETGRLTGAQRRWLEAAGGEVWRPSDWDRILDALNGNHGALRDPREGEGDASAFEGGRRPDQQHPITRYCATQKEADQVAGQLRQDPAVRRVNVRRIK